MISIVEQERRDAVKDYKSQIAMTHADEKEAEYWRGWNDAKEMVQANTYGVLVFATGVFVGASTLAFLNWMLS